MKKITAATVILLLSALTASTQTIKAVRFGKLWDREKVINGAQCPSLDQDLW